VVASGIVHGNPPPGLAPADCTDDHPGPNAIALSVTGSHTLQLGATGAGLEIVGFAALFDADGDQPGERRWRQVAFTEATADRPRFTARWTAVPAVDGKPVVVAAAACLGGDGPTGVVSARTVTGAGFPDAPLDPAAFVRLYRHWPRTAFPRRPRPAPIRPERSEPIGGRSAVTRAGSSRTPAGCQDRTGNRSVEARPVAASTKSIGGAMRASTSAV
jgi:hypothetical protein